MKRLLLVITALFALNVTAQINHDTELIKTVISDCVKNVRKNGGPDSVKSIVVINKTKWHANSQGEPFNKFISNKFNLLEISTYTDFLSKNEKSIKLDIQQESNQFIITSDSVVTEIFRTKGWKGFNKQFPYTRGFVEISAIGYNKTKTQALIYYRQVIDLFYGIGFYVLYEVENDKWIKKQSKFGWASK